MKKGFYIGGLRCGFFAEEDSKMDYFFKGFLTGAGLISVTFIIINIIIS